MKSFHTDKHIRRHPDARSLMKMTSPVIIGQRPPENRHGSPVKPLFSPGIKRFQSTGFVGKNIVKIFSFYTQAPVSKDQLQFIFHIFHNNILPPASPVFPVGHQIQFHLPRTHNPPACHQSLPHTAAPSDLSPDPLQTRTGQ